MDNKNINVQKIILATVATVGLIGIAVVAPNALQIIGQFSKKRKYKGKDQIYYLNRSVKNLTKKGLIRIEIKDGKKFLRLTEKGKEQLAKYELGDLEIRKPKKWDKKWRVVMFDIKENRRGTRTLLRQTLDRLGFVKLQNSVWIFPYDCEELVIMMKSNLFLGKDVLYMTVDNLENDMWLKEIFGLV
ncbi:CRISPR-associated endonuclease Cas2 [Candidatus Campbellbacteria bacterium RIFCSPLOWO2_02_FULL_35_11]|uniref:CRISPR-associated endonuclease Cas2 n=2 Tax=Candidatus Campbelliibacteriota TaxID=1752727 RepID=A0A1F5ELC0_9BACT|nr:MAG: CRISPR-associated endonuclease Cas2 [Candidatus Campbellbacteria bacterium RIFCSPHIGHO2_12_FULL_35_10]OGD70389.1 MAG: CRISPR-associated endonuclease Cas2 [Candidatus Campbellbacteria bacterium RIFCSPLOWO2_02_FULL_35_11]